MLDIAVCSTMYATKRRRRSVKTAKPPMKDPPKSNPSKRHRERLNSELDHLASLLPFEQSVISKLDKLSVLRLAVSYLRTKSYFQAAVHERYALDGHRHALSHHHLYSEPGFTDTDSVLQALNGFLFVVNCDGEVFFSSRTVEQYLGFHQSDIIHQSALELIHSEDRDEFKSQLNWRSQLPQDQQDLSLQQVLLPENCQYLQRCFTVRFRCLLDNTSGFITLEICGRIKLLHSQNTKTGEEPPLALSAMCCPFGPLPLLDVPPRDYTFKTKHKMDMAPVSMDPRGKLLFGYSDRELVEKGGYDLIHPDDLTYYSAAHQELIKTGSSGLIAYRLMTKDFRWIWLQTSSKVIYKNSKPDFVICTHRHLTEDEGKDLVGKRGSEFKLPYPIIDADPSGLGAALEEEEYTKSKSPKSKKGKNQLRDYLQAGRKRKTPYREVYNGINGYSAYSGMNGYPACQPSTDVKAEFMYPYTGQNFAFDADLYRSSYPTLASTMYPATDGFRIEADKHGYTNGYYLEPRQYQHTLQYHGNGYTDLMAQSAKYSYDMGKYSYDAVGGYSLDLAKRGHYEDDLSRYENDLRKYTEYPTDKYSRVNGTYDAFRTGSIYGTNTVLNNDGLLACNTTSHGTSSPCSLYRSDIDRYNQTSLAKVVPPVGATSVITDCKQQVPNGHTSVIRNASPRSNKSPCMNVGGDVSTYNADILSSCTSASWQCNNPTSTKSTTHSTLDTVRSPLIQHSTLDTVRSPLIQHSTLDTVRSPLIQHTTLDAVRSPLIQHSSNFNSRIISPVTAAKSLDGSTACSTDLLSAHVSTSPAMAATATSVIQHPNRNRACEKQAAASGGSTSGSGGIAVPVVKSPSWLHHLPSAAASYNWHLPSDPYSTHQGALHPSTTDGYSATHPISAHTRTIVEAPKYASMRVGEKDDIHGNHGNHAHSNPLLSFSQVTHTLLSSN